MIDSSGLGGWVKAVKTKCCKRWQQQSTGNPDETDQNHHASPVHSVPLELLLCLSHADLKGKPGPITTVDLYEGRLHAAHVGAQAEQVDPGQCNGRAEQAHPKKKINGVSKRCS